MSDDASEGSTGAVDTVVTYYVAANGDDARSCEDAMTPETPRLTLAAGAECLERGERLFLGEGTYAEAGWATSVVPIALGLDAARPTIVAAMPGEDVVIGGLRLDAGSPGEPDSFLVFTDLVLDSTSGFPIGLRLDQGTHDVRFENLEVRNAAEEGVVAHADALAITFVGGEVHDNGVATRRAGIRFRGDDSLFEGMSVHDNGGVGMMFYSSSEDPDQDSVDGNVIRRCSLFRNGVLSDNQITIDGANNLIENNLIYGGPSIAVAIGYDSTTGNVIRHNTIFGNGGHPIWIGVFGAPTGVVIRNNLGFGNVPDAVRVDAGVEVPLEEGNLYTNPNFENAAQADFRLREGSDAIDAGVDLAEVVDDFEGNARPVGAGWDVGALERK